MKKYVILLLFSLRISASFGQYIENPDTVGKQVRVNLGSDLGVTTNHVVPFWMRSNQFGSVPLEGPSMSLFADIHRKYDIRNKRLFDWGGGVDLRGNIGRNSNFTLVEAYLKGKIAFLEVKAGRSRDLDGLVDSTLSTGSFSLSGNALGIPKVALAIPQYTPLPLTDELISIKASFSYGWMGDVPIQYGDNYGALVPTKFHHFSGSVRLGKPSWNLQLYGSVAHDVIWGGDKLIFGDQYHINDLQAFYYVVTGKKYLGARDISKIGNHLGSLDLAAEYKFESVSVRMYHQFFYDKGALVYLANVLDGLTGISVKNNARKTRSEVNWSKVLFEVFYSKDQAGQEGAKFTPSGPEYYYNHAVYTQGYSYKGLGLGTPLITAAADAKSGQVSDPINFFINNRILAANVGFIGSYKDIGVIFKTTFSRNFGEFRTNGPSEQWFNGDRIKQVYQYGRFKAVDQLSTYLELNRKLNSDGYNIGVILANDYGGLLNNSFGSRIKISKNW